MRCNVEAFIFPFHQERVWFVNMHVIALVLQVDLWPKSTPSVLFTEVSMYI